MKNEPSSMGDDEPVLVDTGNGPSVYYRGRFLYSRRDPGKSPAIIAEKLKLLPGTLALLVSPVLDHGIRALAEHLPADSFILAVEHDEKLFAFSRVHRKETAPRFESLYAARPEDVVRFIDQHLMEQRGPFRRYVRVDFSAGGNAHPEFYDRTEELVSEFISTFWKNRVTLIKFGRNYAKNIFKNCAALSKNGFSLRAENVSKPILVAGAGGSLDTHMPFIKRNRGGVFLIAVDAALPAFYAEGVTPDAVVTLESQIWINAAFCRPFRLNRAAPGEAPRGMSVFADISSRVRDWADAPVCFFFTPYTKSSFLTRIRSCGLADFEIPPLGSVGLSALFIAGKIKKARAAGTPHTAPPVLFTGLDFSWGGGFSHSKGSFQIRGLHARANRVDTLEQQRAETTCAANRCGGADDTGIDALYTTDTMARYAGLCAACFSAEGFLRLGGGGLPADFPSVSEAEAEKTIGDFHAAFLSDGGPPLARADTQTTAREFLRQEERKLRELKSILSGESKKQVDSKTLSTLVQELDYLYIHFPDYSGKPSLRSDFLKRIRVELDFFLKTIRTAIDACGTQP